MALAEPAIHVWGPVILAAAFTLIKALFWWQTLVILASLLHPVSTPVPCGLKWEFKWTLGPCEWKQWVGL